MQAERLRGSKITLNARMNLRQIKKHCEVTATAERFLASQMGSERLSVRTYTGILKVIKVQAPRVSRCRAP